MNKIIALDCETGGLEHGKVSLLELYCVILNEKLDPVDELLLSIRPNDGIYHTTAQALSINKIDLIEHDKIALSQSLAGRKFMEFIEVHSNFGREKLTPLGQNVTFDLEMIYTELLGKETCNKFLSYRVEDTGILGSALRRVGLIPHTVSGSLSSYAKHFNIDVAPDHTAKNDTLATVAVYKHMLQTILNVNPLNKYAHEISQF